MVLLLDVAILADQGASSFSLRVFAPGEVFSGAVGVAIIYAFSSFLGSRAPRSTPSSHATASCRRRSAARTRDAARRTSPG